MAISWSVKNAATDALDASAAPVVQYILKDGSARAAPPVVNGGNGRFEVSPTDDDRAVGCILVIDNGVGFTPRRLVKSVHNASNPFAAWFYEDADGAPYAGVGVPTLLPANPALPIAPVPGYPGWLWSLTPAAAQVGTAAAQVLAPAGAYPDVLDLSFDGYGPGVYTPGSGTTTRAILEACRAKVKTVPTSRNALEMFLEHTTGVPFETSPISKRDGFEVVGRDFDILSGFGRAGESEKEFYMVVRLGHAPFSSDDTRESLVARDVHRLAEILEGHLWPVGLQAIWYDRFTIDRTRANWWLTEVWFRVVYTGAIEV